MPAIICNGTEPQMVKIDLINFPNICSHVESPSDWTVPAEMGPPSNCTFQMLPNENEEAFVGLQVLRANLISRFKTNLSNGEIQQAASTKAGW